MSGEESKTKKIIQTATVHGIPVLPRFPGGKCKTDYYGTHCWDMIGIQDGHRFFRCTQCEKCFAERMKPLPMEECV